ncbi:MAG TPA: hypothetical protein VGL93_29515 [Streptosporangiaceae bacterium]|jgi:hypothetical protein
MTPGTPRSPLRLLAICIGTALALAGALALPSIRPTYQERYRPIHSDGRIGQMITTRDFRIRVRQVVLANSLVANATTTGLASKPRVIYTESVWVVIVADVGAMRKKLDATMLEGGQIVTRDGTIYKKDAGMPAKDGTLDDAIPMGPTLKQRFYFQVPRDRLTGAYFEVTKDALNWDDDPQPWQEQWFLPAARYNLGFDTPAATANALHHAAERMPVPGTVF